MSSDTKRGAKDSDRAIDSDPDGANDGDKKGSLHKSLKKPARRPIRDDPSQIPDNFSTGQTSLSAQPPRKISSEKASSLGQSRKKRTTKSMSTPPVSSNVSSSAPPSESLRPSGPTRKKHARNVSDGAAGFPSPEKTEPATKKVVIADPHSRSDGSTDENHKRIESKTPENVSGSSTPELPRTPLLPQAMAGHFLPAKLDSHSFGVLFIEIKKASLPISNDYFCEVASEILPRKTWCTTVDYSTSNPSWKSDVCAAAINVTPVQFQVRVLTTKAGYFSKPKCIGSVSILDIGKEQVSSEQWYQLEKKKKTKCRHYKNIISNPPWSGIPEDHETIFRFSSC